MDMHTSPERQRVDRRWRRRLLSRFLKNGSGSVAIEFTALAIPLSMLIFAILESCISFAGQQVLANAADSVARQLRTGQIKAAEMTETKLREMICDDLEIIVASGCPGLEVDLREYATFEDAAKVRVKLTADKDIDTTDFAVTPGPSMSKNMLRVFYRWPVMTDFMRKSMSNLKDGKTLHFATVTWQNEPFDD
jgi:Flp pilus assembly protein TadG